MNVQNLLQKLKIENKGVNYRKVGRAISIWGIIEKSPILLSQNWNHFKFNSALKLISQSDKLALMLKFWSLFLFEY